MRIPTALSAVFALSVWAAIAAPTTALAQHETAADLLDGERAYRQSCANCHGPDGDVITGIDLGRGQFRRQMTDEDLVRIIRTGIPNTPMPASTMTIEQAQKIVAYLRSRAASASAGNARGDAARGQRGCGDHALGHSLHRILHSFGRAVRGFARVPSGADICWPLRGRVAFGLVHASKAWCLAARHPSGRQPRSVSERCAASAPPGGAGSPPRFTEALATMLTTPLTTALTTTLATTLATTQIRGRHHAEQC